jgi:hypothetical protein
MGGFGDVYSLRLRDNPSKFRIVKFLRNINEFEAAHKRSDEIIEKILQMFRREWETLKKISKRAPKSFPAFYGAGEFKGRKFYLMEKLSPLSHEELLAFGDDKRRIKFIVDLCEAIETLHTNGLVHYDIKPANVLYRREADQFVIGDFGSVHKEQKHLPQAAILRTQIENSISMLSDGRRIAPRTIGYCDPIDSLHTIHADIYAIGQVIRDMFAAEVPATWARIILKCINRQFSMRYNSVAEVKKDVLSMGRDGIRLLSRQLENLVTPSGAAWIHQQNKIYVSSAASKNGNGSEKKPYKKISMALEAAKDDSVILVGPGVYEETLVIQGKKVNLIATNGPKETMIKGVKGNSVVLIRDGSDGSVLKGFTITGGSGSPQPSSYGFDYYGGGVNVNVSAIIADCVIAKNGIGIARKDACTFGGGVFVSQATVTIRNCLISENYAWACGGGLMASGNGAALIVENTTVERNSSTDFFGNQGGIGIANDATLSVSDSIAECNSGDQIGAFGNVYAKGTRAQVESSYVEGGVRACGISLFIPHDNNYKERPNKGCGCSEDIKGFEAPLLTCKNNKKSH